MDRLIGAKIRSPEPQGLRRGRLLEQLGDVWSRGLGVVTAPAGSGKTTLLAQFASAVRVPVAWYRAESGDDTEVRLLKHLEAALCAAIPALVGGWQELDDLVYEFEESGAAALIVVDDLHEIVRTSAEHALERFVAHRPAGVALVVASRRPPAWNLSRLRVSGSLVEIRADDLRFRSWEVEELFARVYREPLGPEDAAALARRTDGWAAALQLFHLATRGLSSGERTTAISALAMRSELIGEYLARNVLEGLPSELRLFLLLTSSLGRLSGALCDRLLGRADSKAVLEDLERSQLFISRTGDGSYRYHDVLRTHLEARLDEELGRAEASDLYRRAGAAMAAEGALVGALRAYCRADDPDAIGRLLGGGAEPLRNGSISDVDLLPRSIDDNDFSDQWGNGLLALLRGWHRSRAGEDARAELDAAAASFERLGAGALAAALRSTSGPLGSGGVDPSLAPEVTVRTFGGFSLRIDGRELDLCGVKPRARALLRFLTLRHGRAVHREVLAEALWPGASPEAGVRNVQVAVCSLRRAVEEPSSEIKIVRRGEAYELCFPDGSVDLGELEHAITACREAVAAGLSEVCESTLNEVFAIYRDELLPEDGPAEWIVDERERWRNEVLHVAEDAVETLLTQGEPLAAAGACERALRIDRFRERLWQLLQAARNAIGDKAAAAKAREAHIRMLNELGLEEAHG